MSDRSRSVKGSSFLDFIDELRRLWTASGRDVKIVRKSPKSDDESFPVITYRILKRYPHPSFKEKKPRFRGMAPSVEIPGDTVEVYGQIFQVFVEFKVYSVSDEEADEIAEDLEDFIYLYSEHFKKNGVKEIYFEEQSLDSTSNKFHVPVAERTLVFDMQFEKITLRYLSQINQVAVQANIDKNKSNKEEF